MVVKGLKRITNFGPPNEKLLTNHGVFTRKAWQEKEAGRFPLGQVLKDERGFTALFIKGEEDAGSES